MRILIAEDDPTSRAVLAGCLTKWGYDVVATRDGAEAWAALTREDAPRLAILDWVMPGLDGLDVLNQVREAEATEVRNPVYVILLTGKGSQDDVVRGFAAGADDYVTKPFDPEELCARVRVGARLVELQHRLTERVAELETALSQVNTLQGLLPICSYCKKVRDDQNYWTEVESYIEKVSDAEFSHGVCPSCYEKHLRPRLDSLRQDQESEARR